MLITIDIESYAIVYVLFEEDNQNLETVIALYTLYPNVRIATALFNEKMIPHLKNDLPNIEILNPARIAASEFVSGIYGSNKVTLNKASKIEKKHLPKIAKPSTLLTVLIFGFVLLITTTTWYFHYFEHLKWLDSFYFVIVTVTSVGYGDFSLLNANDLSKLVGIVLMLSSSIFIWLIFSLLLEHLFKRKSERSLGRKKYNYSKHIILCG